MIASHHPLLLSSSSLSPPRAAPRPSIRLYLLWPVLCRPHLLFYYLPQSLPRPTSVQREELPHLLSTGEVGAKAQAKGKAVCAAEV